MLKHQNIVKTTNSYFFFRYRQGGSACCRFWVQFLVRLLFVS